jgi:hypothetical protein
VKWGQDTLITDESIKRRGHGPGQPGVLKLVNQNVKYVDSVALAAVASAVTQTTAAAADWTTGDRRADPQGRADGEGEHPRLNQGYDPDVVVVDDLNYASRPRRSWPPATSP